MRSISARIERDLLGRVLPPALVLDREVADSGPERRRPLRRPRVGLEPALVERLRDVAADVRVEPERPLEEDAAILGDRRRVPEQVLEHRGRGPLRMRPLEHLAELERVAEEHEVPRARPHGERVGERDLAALVDEEVVERPVEARIGEEPGRSGRERPAEAVRERR